ncbi:MAG: hypothetical protein Q8N31_10145 [Reyranella sp.]|nr:hypothetical protein [Reyranella sp.]MDP3160366.1 hypothetical protein [Reyranella sp.]
MISDDDLLQAMRESRGDKQLAFVKLERRFRETFKKNMASLPEEYGNVLLNSLYIEYMNHTVAAVKALRVPLFEGWELPSHEINQSVSSVHQDFTAAVDNYSLQVRLAAAEQVLMYSIHLTDEDKRKIHHFGARIRDQIQKSAVREVKRDQLLRLLNNFLREVDSDYTKMEVVGAFITGATHIARQSLEDLDPIRGWIETIADIFGTAQEEQPLSLPPAQTKQIPGPNLPKQPARTPRAELDDDIPF